MCFPRAGAPACIAGTRPPSDESSERGSEKRGSGASGGKRRIPRSTARRVHSRREATRKWHVVRPQRQRPLIIRGASSWVRTAAAQLPHSCRTAAATRALSAIAFGHADRLVPHSRAPRLAPRLAPCLGRGCTGPCTSAPPMHGRRSSVVAVAGALLPASAGHTQRGRRAIGVAGWQGRTVRAASDLRPPPLP